jgi:hypothetical protein
MSYKSYQMSQKFDRTFGSPAYCDLAARRPTSNTLIILQMQQTSHSAAFDRTNELEATSQLLIVSPDTSCKRLTLESRHKSIQNT